MIWSGYRQQTAVFTVCQYAMMIYFVWHSMQTHCKLKGERCILVSVVKLWIYVYPLFYRKLHMHSAGLKWMTNRRHKHWKSKLTRTKGGEGVKRSIISSLQLFRPRSGRVTQLKGNISKNRFLSCCRRVYGVANYLMVP